MHVAAEIDPPYKSTAKATLEGCLIDGDSAKISSDLRRRRNAFGISLIAEVIALAVLVMAPLMRSVAHPNLITRSFVPLVLGAKHPALITKHPLNQIHAPAIHSIGGAITYPVKGTPRKVASASEDEIDEVISGGEAIADSTGVDSLQFHGLKPPDPTEPAHRNADKRAEDSPPLKLSETLVQAQMISRVEPKYPALAIATRTQGIVRLHAIISREGNITELEVLSGHPLLIQAALDAVMQWKYRPTLLHGQPIEVETTITVMFQMRR